MTRLFEKLISNTIVNDVIVPHLTHRGLVTHICLSKLTIIGSDNGLSPGRHQAITWTNAGILFIRALRIHFSEIVSEIHTFSFQKIHLKMSSAKWRQFCLDLNLLTRWGRTKRADIFVDEIFNTSCDRYTGYISFHFLGIFPFSWWNVLLSFIVYLHMQIILCWIWFLYGYKTMVKIMKVYYFMKWIDGSIILLHMPVLLVECVIRSYLYFHK